MKIFNPTDCKGQVLVIVIISIITLVILVGLAIDSGRAYSVRAKLNGALDAAGIAAARAVAYGNEEAKEAATTFFNSNYPTGYMESTPVFCPDDGNPTITPDPTTGDVAITVWARANMPTLFMKIVGQDSVNVSATTTATRRAVDLAFVVDNTGSIGSDGPDVRARSIDFVRAFQPNFDRMALIKYAFGAEVPVAFESDRGFDITTVESEINAFNFDGGTNCAEGFWNAKRQHNIANNPASLRVIVFFTDGATNTFASTFQKAGETSFIHDRFHSGSIATQETAHYAAGFWLHYRVKTPNPDPWNNPNYSIGYYVTDIEDQIKSLPQYYNPCIDGICADPHTINSGGSCVCNNDPNEDPGTDPNNLEVFNVLTTNPGLEDIDLFRPVTQLSSNFDRQELYTKINRASRNLLEEMARKARRQGIVVYTLGLGPQLRQTLGPDNEKGEDLLIHMANFNQTDPSKEFYNTNYNPNEPEGFYCYAEDTKDLKPCYDQIIQEIIRLTI